MKIILLFLRRSILFFIVLGLISLWLVDYQKINQADKIKTLYYEQPGALTALVDTMLGKSTMLPEELDQFIYYYEKFTQNNPESADAYYLLGYCYFQKGLLDSSINAYAIATQLDPDILLFHYNLAALYFNSADYDHALSHLKKAVGLSPAVTLDFLRASQQIIVPLIERAQISENEMKQRIKSFYRDSYELIILSNIKLNKYDDALVWARRAITGKMGHEAKFYFYAGQAAYELQQYPQAIEFLQKSIELSRDNVEAYQILSLSLNRLAQPELAQKAFEAAEAIKSMKQQEEDSLDLRLRVF